MHDFVAKCLDKDAMARSGAEELLKHPFLKHAREEGYLAQQLLGNAVLRAPSSVRPHANASPVHTLVTLLSSSSFVSGYVAEF
jgi:serine/threonine protein kinase